MPATRYFKPFIHSLSFLLLLSSCTFYYKPQEGQSIDTGTRNEIASLCHQIYKGLQTGNSQLLKNIFSSKVDIGKSLDSVVNGMPSLGIDTSNKFYTTLEEFYLTGTLFKKKEILDHTGNDWINNYRITIPTDQKDVYVILFSMPTVHKNYSLMTYCIFVREKKKWKLWHLYVNNFTCFDKQAPELYDLAKKKFDSGDTYSAALYMVAANYCDFPQTQNISYNYESEMKNFARSLGDKVKMPGEIEAIPTHPEILRLTIRMYAEGIEPLVVYKSKMPISDMEAVRKECIDLHNNINTYLPRIRQSFDSVHYSIVNEYPNSYHEIRHVDLALKS